MKELKTKKSAEGARVKEKSDALPRAAKRMLRAELMEKQASRQRDTREKAPERAAEEQVERAAMQSDNGLLPVHPSIGPFPVLPAEAQPA